MAIASDVLRRGRLCAQADRALKLLLLVKRIDAKSFGGDGELRDALPEALPKPYSDSLFGHHLECGFARLGKRPELAILGSSQRLT